MPNFVRAVLCLHFNADARCIHQVFALRNNSRVGKEAGLAVDRDEKVQGARQLLERVMSGAPHRKPVIAQVHQTIEAYIKLAVLPVDKNAPENVRDIAWCWSNAA